MPDYRPKHDPYENRSFVLTPSQTTAQFVLYSLLSVPILLGLDFRRINEPQHVDLRTLLQNPEILAVSQDPLSEQGRRLRSIPATNSTLEVWSKNLTNGSIAVVLFHHCRTPVCSETHTISVTMTELGIATWPATSVRDLINRRDEPVAAESVSASLGSNSVSFLKLAKTAATTEHRIKLDDTDQNYPAASATNNLSLIVPVTIVWDGATLLAARHRALAGKGNASLIRAIAAIADKQMDITPISVVNKTHLPPSGDAHDYMSVASYFWPCNAKCNASLEPFDCSEWCANPGDFGCNWSKYVDMYAWECTPPGKLNPTFNPAVGCDEQTGLPWVSHDRYSSARAHPWIDKLDRERVYNLWDSMVPMTLA